MEQRYVFDEVAELYLRARPGYPSALFDDLVALTGLRSGARILEIGSGPGTATAPLAERGHRLTCLEPGPRLAALALRQLAPEWNVAVENASFESWPLPAQPFDLVMAAQSFHWVDPEVRCEKSARALAIGGALALIANRPVPGDSELEGAIQAAYAAIVPDMGENKVLTNTIETFAGELRACRAFGRIEAREYPWSVEYSASEYRDLLETHSDHRMLSDTLRNRLHDAIAAAIIGHGGRLHVDYVAVLVIGFRESRGK